MSRLAPALAIALLAGLPAVAAAQDPVPTTPTPPTPPATAPVEGRVLMNGSWDGRRQPRRAGLPAQWIGFQGKPLGRRTCFQLSCARHNLRLVRSPTRDGSFAARFEVRDRDNPFGSDERAEVQGRPTGQVNSRRWYTWSVYLPANFNPRGANAGRFMYLMQWAVEDGASPLGLTVDRGHLTLQVLEQSRPGRIVSAYRPWGVPLRSIRGRWVDFAMFVRWSTGNAGQVQIWVDGVQQQMNWPLGNDDGNPAAHGGVGASVFTGRTLVPRGGPTFVKQGIVRSTRLSGRTIVFHDALRVRAATTTPVPVAAPPATPDPVPAPPA